MLLYQLIFKWAQSTRYSELLDVFIIKNPLVNLWFYRCALIAAVFSKVASPFPRRISFTFLQKKAVTWGLKKKGVWGGGCGVFIPADLLSSVILFYFYLFPFILNPAMVLFDYKFQAISISRNTIFFIAEPWDEM